MVKRTATALFFICGAGFGLIVMFVVCPDESWVLSVAAPNVKQRAAGICLPPSVHAGSKRKSAL